MENLILLMANIFNLWSFAYFVVLNKDGVRVEDFCQRHCSSCISHATFLMLIHGIKKTVSVDKRFVPSSTHYPI